MNKIYTKVDKTLRSQPEILVREGPTFWRAMGRTDTLGETIIKHIAIHVNVQSKAGLVNRGVQIIYFPQGTPVYSRTLSHLEAGKFTPLSS